MPQSKLRKQRFRKLKGNGVSQCCVDCRSRRQLQKTTVMRARGKAKAIIEAKSLELAV